jgi:hypothetical protein
MRPNTNSANPDGLERQDKKISPLAIANMLEVIPQPGHGTPSDSLNRQKWGIAIDRMFNAFRIKNARMMRIQLNRIFA